MMKNAIRTLCGLTLLTVALYAPCAFADPVYQEKTRSTTTTTTSTTNSGTVSQFTRDMIVIKTTPTSSPITYESTETTSFVDEAGNPVEAESAIKAGVPVTIYYSKSGDKMVATKVVVKRSAPIPPRG